MPNHRYISTKGERGKIPAGNGDPQVSALDYAKQVGMKSIRNLHENKAEITGELAGLMRNRSANRSALGRTMDKHADATTVSRKTSMDKRQFLKGILNDAEAKNTENDK
jgi:hypothetical protein